MWYGVATDIRGRVSKLSVDLSHHSTFSGEIPRQLLSFPGLQRLSLKGPRSTTVVPPWLGDIVHLRNLWLSGSFTGNIPPELGNLVNLTSLTFFLTQLTGELPPELKWLRYLSYITIEGNQLRGELPSELANLANLMGLLIRDEPGLTGDIPQGLGTIPNLEFRFRLLIAYAHDSIPAGQRKWPGAGNTSASGRQSRR